MTATPQAKKIVSLVCPKQDLALSIKAAFSRDVSGVMPASIVERLSQAPGRRHLDHSM
jgi:hypothetical protein